MDIVIRKYRDNDFERVNHILNEAFSCEKSHNFVSDTYTELVACIDEKVVGYLLLTKVLNPIKNFSYMLVDYVSVDSRFRGVGVGAKLMTFAYEIAKDLNCQYLQLTCSRFREDAHRLYKSQGYVMRDSDIFRKEII